MSENNLGFSIMFLNLFKSLFIADKEKPKRYESIKEESENLLDIAEGNKASGTLEKSEIVRLEFDYEKGILVPFGTAIKKSEDIAPKVCVTTVKVEPSTAGSDYSGEKRRKRRKKKPKGGVEDESGYLSGNQTKGSSNQTEIKPPGFNNNSQRFGKKFNHNNNSPQQHQQRLPHSQSFNNHLSNEFKRYQYYAPPAPQQSSPRMPKSQSQQFSNLLNGQSRNYPSQYPAQSFRTNRQRFGSLEEN
jgi:hypothetical protein